MHLSGRKSETKSKKGNKISQGMYQEKELEVHKQRTKAEICETAWEMGITFTNDRELHSKIL